MRRCTVTLLVLIFSLPALAGAQDAEAEDIWFRDSNRLVVGNSSTRFEAVIGGDLLLWDHEDWHGWRVNVYGSTLLRLRMSKRRSSPIRTPSFEPKATAQFIRQQTSGSSASAWIINIVPWAHHSNGQDGCALMRHSRTVDEDDTLGGCVADEDFDPTNPEINLRDGSFSTNYTRVGLYRNWTWQDDEQAVTLGGELERHHPPGSFMPGDISEALEERYGKFRMSTSIRYANRTPLGRVETRYSYQRIGGISDGPTGDAIPPETRWRSEATRNVNILEAVLFPGKIRNWGLYGRWYHGRDYYNIHFEEEVSRVEVGFTFNWQGVGGGLTGTPVR